MDHCVKLYIYLLYKIDLGKANKRGSEDTWEKKQAKIDIIK